MALGDFYNYLTIEQYTASDSSYGDDDTYTWSTYASCWAERLQELPTEGIYRDQPALKNMVSWRVRYDSGITEMMRIYFDGLYYQITGIEVEGRRKFLKLRGYKYINT
jgi:SPP1 family predicted phage head-tail adaptor